MDPIDCNRSGIKFQRVFGLFPTIRTFCNRLQKVSSKWENKVWIQRNDCALWFIYPIGLYVYRHNIHVHLESNTVNRINLSRSWTMSKGAASQSDQSSLTARCASQIYSDNTLLSRCNTFKDNSRKKYMYVCSLLRNRRILEIFHLNCIDFYLITDRFD